MEISSGSEKGDSDKGGKGGSKGDLIVLSEGGNLSKLEKRRDKEGKGRTQERKIVGRSDRVEEMQKGTEEGDRIEIRKYLQEIPDTLSEVKYEMIERGKKEEHNDTMDQNSEDK